MCCSTDNDSSPVLLCSGVVAKRMNKHEVLLLHRLLLTLLLLLHTCLRGVCTGQHGV
jgi:hypothetical protein